MNKFITLLSQGRKPCAVAGLTEIKAPCGCLFHCLCPIRLRTLSAGGLKLESLSNVPRLICGASGASV